MRLLYCSKKQTSQATDFTNLDDTIVEFTPSVCNGFFRKGEQRNFKKLLVRLLFQSMTFGKAKLVCAVGENNQVMHTSYVVGRCYKFPDLGKEDYTIGPCFTEPACRGKGIYPQVLRYICANLGDERTTFYMSVDSQNNSSVKGIEKAGFVRVGTVRKTKLFKRYYYDIHEG